MSICQDHLILKENNSFFIKNIITSYSMGDNKSLYVYNFCNGCFIATDPHIKVDIIDY